MVNGMDINELVKTCKILLLDIEGTTTSISFVKDKLFPYVEEHVQGFLESQWKNEYVKEAIAALRKLELEDKENKMEGLVEIPGEDKSKEDQIEGLVKNVKWQMSSDRKTGALKTLQGLIWKQGYDTGDIKGHVYDDVLPALEQWKSSEDRKVYIYSSGSVQAQKLLFGQSVAGDLLKYIDGHFDTSVGQKREAISYTRIAEQIGCKPEEILFLTDIVEEAEAATTAGLNRALVIRGTDSRPTLVVPALTSLAPLCPTLKRPHDQEGEEKPAKIAKTIEEEATSAEVTEPPKPTETITDSKEEEVMQVDEVQETEVKEVTSITVEDITDTATDTNLPVITVEPIVEESCDKMDEDEKIHTTEQTNGAADKEITEIEEVKEPNVDVITAEPVVEEPESVEMAELQTAGEALDKECDEILTKVKSITDAPVKDKVAIAKNGEAVPETESKMDDGEDKSESAKPEEVTVPTDEVVTVNEQIEKADNKVVTEEKNEVEKTNAEESKASEQIEKVVEPSEVETKAEEVVPKVDEVDGKVQAEEAKVDEVDSKMDEVNNKKEKMETNEQTEKSVEVVAKCDGKTEKPSEVKVAENEKVTNNDSEVEKEKDVLQKNELTETKENVTEVKSTKSKENDVQMETVEAVSDKVEAQATDISENKEKVDVKVDDEIKTDNKPKHEEDTKSATEPMESNDTVPSEEPQINGKTNGSTEQSLNGKTNGEGETEPRIENGKDDENGKGGENGKDAENGKQESEKVTAEAETVPEIKMKALTTDMVTEQATET